MTHLARAFVFAVTLTALACGGSSPRPAAPTPAAPTPADPLAALTAATAPSTDVCVFDAAGVGTYAARLIAAAGDPPPTATCEPAASGRQCEVTIAVGEPLEDGDGGPAVWFTYELDAAGALVPASLRCGEQL